MRRLFRIRFGALALLSGVSALPPAAAQPPQTAAVHAWVDSVPQTTVVPVQEAPVQIVDRTTVFEVPDDGLSRTERRTLRAKQYAASIDSLVQSHNYLFYPATMRELPDGAVRSVYADYFFFGVFADHVEVHLPVDRAGSHYLERLNFDSMSVSSYQLARVQCGWMISFDVSDNNTNYHACFDVSTATGETVLTLITPAVTMRYTGRIGDRMRGQR